MGTDGLAPEEQSAWPWWSSSSSRRPVVFVGFDGLRDVQPQIAEFQAQGLPGDPQQAGGLVLIPAGVLQDAGQQEPVHLAVRFRVQVAEHPARAVGG